MTNKKATDQSGEQNRRDGKQKVTEKIDQLERYYLALWNAPITNRMAAHKAGLPVEGCCRYKRYWEKNKRLWRVYRGIDPVTKNPAYFLTTNPKFKPLDPQLELFTPMGGAKDAA